MSKKNGKWIKEGAEVAHYDNPKQKMFVEKFIKEILRQDSPAEADATTEDGQRCFIRNVKCHWWERQLDGSPGQFREGFFHTKELVPWEVAKDGYMACLKFLGQA